MIIAISGWKRSGKDTLVQYIIDQYDFKRVSFADPLKDMVSKNLNVDRKDLDHPTRKEAPLLNLPVDPQDDFSKIIVKFMVKEFRSEDGKFTDIFCENENMGNFWNGSKFEHKKLYWTPRALAILVGSTFRSAYSSHWVKQAIDLIQSMDKPVVISDLRYKSEVKQLKEVFGKELITVRINRFDSSPSSDPSELDLVDYEHDVVLENKGTKDEFFLQYERAMELHCLRDK